MNKSQVTNNNQTQSIQKNPRKVSIEGWPHPCLVLQLNLRLVTPQAPMQPTWLGPSPCPQPLCLHMLLLWNFFCVTMLPTFVLLCLH